MPFKLYTLIILFLVFNSKLISQSSCPLFSTYFGGNQFDEVKSVCVDQNKNSYIIGNTYSTDLPVTLGLINDTASGNYDVFVAKFDSCGLLIWSTYFGGTGYESAEKMELTKDGNLVFCGYTSSVNTHTTTGCFQPANNGGYDCFITKITPSGLIIWSTYFGQSGGDFAFDIKVDALDNIIIGGTSTSTNLYTTAASFQSIHQGNTDAFIARFSKNGQLNWCTYYGGNASEDIHALAIDSDANIIGVGESFSTSLNTSAGAFQSSNDGASDVYIIKLDSNCTRIFSSYIGGSGSDDAWGVVCDSLNNIFLSGHTNSSDFDTTVFAYQTLNKGGVDCYITKWSPTGSLLISTLIGGTLNDYNSRLIALKPSQLLLLSKTQSTDLPTYPSSQQAYSNGNYDIYITTFNSNTLYPVFGTYFGGSVVEDATDIKQSDNSTLVFCGSSNSTDYPVSASAYQTSLNNSTDGIITKINLSSGIITSVDEQLEKALIEVCPNPFSDFLIIKSDLKFKIEIKNLLGQSILVSENNSLIDTKTIPQGVYMITINAKTYRLIKQ